MPASVALPAVFASCAYQHGSQVVLSHACFVLLHLWRVVALQIFLSFRQPTCPARAVPAAASLAECVLRQAVVWQQHGEVAVKCCPCGCRRMRVLLPSLITLRGRAYSTLHTARCLQLFHLTRARQQPCSCCLPSLAQPCASRPCTLHCKCVVSQVLDLLVVSAAHRSAMTSAGEKSHQAGSRGTATRTSVAQRLTV
ncbi:hypothetical protein COO60DRAFT_1494242 [Scenedesmus sp. NREL 46B-D3]|nr:hypothetical protein COO60DRAFT_1494242 [Scenedesmus sp. NREL 46B-D3]